MSSQPARCPDVQAPLVHTYVQGWLRRARLAFAQRPVSHHLRLPAPRSKSNVPDAAAFLVHELVAPVATMRILVARLSAPDLSHDELRQITDAVDKELALLDGLIRDVQLLSAASMGGIHVDTHPVSLRDIVGTAQNYGRALPGNHTMRWPELDDTWVWADRERITQVLRNLLANAAKYSPPGSVIEVGVEKHQDRVQISVIDHGPGIAPTDVDRIFQKFARGHHRDPRIPGMGIGLYLARAIVRAHGSDLSLTQTPGGGATFSFQLPTAHPPASTLRERTLAPCATMQ